MAKAEAKKALDFARKGGVARAVQDDTKVDHTLAQYHITLTEETLFLCFAVPP
jgi:hypothetical protein